METRVTRYSKKNRLKRRIKRNVKNLPKKLIKNTIYLVVGLVYATYLLIRSFDNLVVKFFMRLPRLMKVAIIYLLIFNLVQDVYDIFKLNDNLNTISTIASTLNIKSEPVNLIENEEKEEVCVFDSISCQIAQKGQELGLNEEQILISIAISKWETGNYTSSLFKNNNNVGGMYCNGSFIKYDSLDSGIHAFVSNLKRNYFDIGLTTIETIGGKYCPIGAKNDPTGLNKNWIPGVTQKLNELRNK